MQIRWANIIATLLGVFVAVMLLRHWPSIRAFLASMSDIGPGHEPGDKLVGLVAFGLVLVGIVAIVKILTHGRE